MTADVAGYLPITLGAGAVIVAGIVSIIKGYRWLVGEIREVINEAMSRHEQIESTWQREIERRLDVIEAKVDRLAEREGDR